MAQNHETIGPALGKIASGLYVITATIEDQPVGMLASFVEQAGFEPPTISVAVSRGRHILSALLNDGYFGLNILGKTNGPLVKPFAKPDEPRPFSGLDLVGNSYGVPQLADAWAFLACKVRDHIDLGDHLLFAAEVLDGRLQKEHEEPMIRIRANGFGY